MRKEILWVFVILCTLTVVQAETYFYAGHKALAVRDEELKYLYSDRMGTPIEDHHLPFGEALAEGNRLSFTGKERDASGTIYLGARYYDVESGLFTSIDPLHDGQSYQYVNNNPLNYYDPTGMKGEVVENMVLLGEGLEGRAYYVDNPLRGPSVVKQFHAHQISQVEAKAKMFADIEELASKGVVRKNLVPKLYEVDVAAGRLTMEFIEGKPLGEVKVSAKVLEELMGQIKILAEHGIYLFDTPENMIVNKYGQLVIIDAYSVDKKLFYELLPDEQDAIRIVNARGGLFPKVSSIFSKYARYASPYVRPVAKIAGPALGAFGMYLEYENMQQQMGRIENAYQQVEADQMQRNCMQCHEVLGAAGLGMNAESYHNYLEQK